MADPVRPEAPATPGEVFANGAKAIAEIAVIPGVSLIADGDVRAGIAHGVVGWGASLFLGPVAWFVVAANSYSRSVTGHNLYEHFVPERWVHRRPEPA